MVPTRSPHRGERRPWFGVVGIALALNITVACTSDPNGHGSGTMVQDSLGITIKSHAEVGLWSEGQGWTLLETLRIKPDESDPDRLFEQIVGVDADDAGRIVIVDGGANRVHTFDDAGRGIASFGRTGEGPGEFPRMSLLESSQRVVVDTLGQINVLGGDGRLSVFSWEGELLGVYMPGTEQGTISGVSGWLRSHAGATLISRQTMTTEPPLAVTQALFRMEGPGEERFVMEIPVRQPPEMTPQGFPRMEVLGTVTAWAVMGESHVALASSDEYSIRLLDVDGTVQWIIRRDREGQVFSDADREVYRRLARENMTDSGIPESLRNPMVDAIVFPDRWPIVGGLLEGPDGTLWVRRIDRDKALEGPDWMRALRNQLPGPEWDVFDPEGRFLGTVVLPAGFRALQFRGDDLYGILEDALEVQSVVRLRLMR